MIFIAIIAALCGVASLIISLIIEIAFFMTLAKICAVIVVVSLLIGAIKLVVSFFDC